MEELWRECDAVNSDLFSEHPVESMGDVFEVPLFSILIPLGKVKVRDLMGCMNSSISPTGHLQYEQVARHGLKR
jgi:hypothetical protein